MFNDLRSEVIVRLVVIVGIIYIFWLKLTVHKWYLLWTLGFCFLRYRWPWPFLAIFIRPFSFPVAKDFQTVWLSNIVAWWRLFHRRIVRTTFDIYVFLMFLPLLCTRSPYSISRQSSERKNVNRYIIVEYTCHYQSI